MQTKLAELSLISVPPSHPHLPQWILEQLCSGQFGKMHKAQLTVGGPKPELAVKVLKLGASDGTGPSYCREQPS